MDPKWDKINKVCNKIINAVLEEKMIIKVQKLGVTYNKGEKEVCLSNFHKVGHVWKQMRFEVSRARQPN